MGSAAKAGQVQGNFNNIIMLRVRETKTAELITSQLPKVDIYKNTIVSGASDTPSPDTKTDFTSSTQDRISTESMPLLEPSELIQLPRGQAFVLTNGGVLYKVRMPLPSQEQDIMMPDSINTLSQEMAKSYSTGEQWWVSSNPVWEKPEIDNDSDINCPEENELPLHKELDIDDDEKSFLHTLHEDKE